MRISTELIKDRASITAQCVMLYLIRNREFITDNYSLYVGAGCVSSFIPVKPKVVVNYQNFDTSREHGYLVTYDASFNGKTVKGTVIFFEHRSGDDTIIVHKKGILPPAGEFDHYEFCYGGMTEMQRHSLPFFEYKEVFAAAEYVIKEIRTAVCSLSEEMR